jgi:hypothetical protein
MSWYCFITLPAPDMSLPALRNSWTAHLTSSRSIHFSAPSLPLFLLLTLYFDIYSIIVDFFLLFHLSLEGWSIIFDFFLLFHLSLAPYSIIVDIFLLFHLSLEVSSIIAVIFLLSSLMFCFGDWRIMKICFWLYVFFLTLTDWWINIFSFLFSF